jgi:cytoskeleton protein RodZ
MAGFGSLLREERIRQGITLEMVEKETKIRKVYLAALEEENFSLLPPQVYAVGFARRYSKFLNLDEEKMASLFKSLAFPEPEEEAEPEPAAVKNTLLDGHKKNKLINTVSAIIFIIVIFGLGSFVLKYLNQPEFAENPGNKNPDITAHDTDNNPDNEPVQPPATVNEIALKVLVKPGMYCWLSVTADGNNIFTGTLTSEQSQEFKANQTLKIRAGNAGALQLQVNGKDIGPLGNNGEVVDKEFNINELTP